MPEGLGRRIDTEILPVGRSTRDALLDPMVLDVTRKLSDEELLFYCAHQMPDGWIGVACASNSARVEQALQPILGNSLTVVAVKWTTSELQSIDEALTGYDFEDGLVSFGKFMNPAGQLKIYALVRMVTPRIASDLSFFDPDALVITSWVQKL